MVEVRGLEPLNACVSDMCVNHLHHTSKTPHILSIPRLTAEDYCQITPFLQSIVLDLLVVAISQV